MDRPRDCTDFIEAAVDLDAAIQSLVREVYEESTEDVRYYAHKVKAANQRKKAIRKYLTGLRAYQGRVISAARERKVDINQSTEDVRAQVAEIMEELSCSHEVDDVAYGLGIPSQVPPEGATKPDELDAILERWDEELQSVGDDAQLANVDMQNLLQKQQQTLQMLSSVSKTLHDTAMAVVRKIS
jgi:hypothetical protein